MSKETLDQFVKEQFRPAGATQDQLKAILVVQKTQAVS